MTFFNDYTPRVNTLLAWAEQETAYAEKGTRKSAEYYASAETLENLARYLDRDMPSKEEVKEWISRRLAKAVAELKGRQIDADERATRKGQKYALTRLMEITTW